MCRAVDTLLDFTDNVAIVEDPITTEQTEGREFEKHEDASRRTNAKPYATPSL